jgi:hypothetical protein
MSPDQPDAASAPRARTERRPPRRRTPIRYLLWAVVIAVVFAAGLALGEALHDNPSGRTQTLVRTLTPLEVPPARETVTVTRTR